MMCQLFSMQVFRVRVCLLLLQGVPVAALEGRAQERLQEIKSTNETKLQADHWRIRDDNKYKGQCENEGQY